MLPSSDLFMVDCFPLYGAKTGVLICETKWLRKWREGEVMSFGADALVKLQARVA